VLLLHNKSGKALVARDAGAVRPIASITKVQAALVLRDRGLALDQGTVINRADHRAALGGARTRLELRWTYRNRDLLHAALMSSDNRATSALGRAVGLSARALVAAMNARARRVGLKKTRFEGPVGLSYGNVSSAWELSRILREAAHDPLLARIMGKRDFTLVPMRGRGRVHYRNTNPLVRTLSGVRFLASKTGYNREAGYCLAAVARLKGLGEYTFVVLGAPSKGARVRDLRALIDWVRRRPQKGRSSDSPDSAGSAAAAGSAATVVASRPFPPLS
jgi:D-alanyl-D-alanine endopeptidase (penicillin-binding protein 7)